LVVQQSNREQSRCLPGQLLAQCGLKRIGQGDNLIVTTTQD
jgi:hypothetical protein